MISYRIFSLIIVLFYGLLNFFCHALADHSVGVYGVNKESRKLINSDIPVVFLPAEKEMIRFYTAVGKEVYLSLNVFGGTEAWERFPDSIPITSHGEKLDGNHGGVCPTHREWRSDRLQLLSRWLSEYSKKGGIDGVWLEFIRYPGNWHVQYPRIPDTCYCNRCLSTFQNETGVSIPDELVITSEKAEWIKRNVPLKWMAWKKGNIVSFVREARAVFTEYSAERSLKLGAFIVPWKKSDFDGALSFLLAQDAEQLEPYVDLFSPMVYHQMVGHSVNWVGDVIRYFKEMTNDKVWPIIQAKDLLKEEFVRTIEAVSDSGVERLLVYRFADIKPDQWNLLRRFSPTTNLISDPHFEFVSELKKVPGEEAANGWVIGEGGKIRDSRFQRKTFEDTKVVSFGITGGNDQQGSVRIALPACEANKSYRFTAEFLRDSREDADTYPVVRIWGKEYSLNTHRVAGRFQRLAVDVECGTKVAEKDKAFSFLNRSSQNTFWIRNPVLKASIRKRNVDQRPLENNFFPIGVYGGSNDELSEIEKAGLNTAVVRLNKETIKACIDSEIHCTLSVPRDPETLIALLDQLENLLREGEFSFYVNDEPGIHSFPVWKSEDIQRILKDRYPQRFTNMAIVRPQVISHYHRSADYFMLDQYPIPNMPLTWLSDSMDEAAEFVGRNRLHSVIQAFGGGRFSAAGWPRLPTFAEMNNLAFLSVISGSRGLYFYTWPEITATKESRGDFLNVIKRLNSLRSWLEQENEADTIFVKMVSRYGVDPSGRSAVKCAMKSLQGTKMLLCANTIRTYTEAEIALTENDPEEWQEYYTGERFYSLSDAVTLSFSPLEVKVLMEVIQ